ncbi:penicillin-binding protein, partial [Streptomyces albidoflavus]
MSEHRRKPPPQQGGGRAAARRSQSGRRAAPRGASHEPSASFGSEGEERPYGGRAEARRAAKGGRRRAADPGTCLGFFGLLLATAGIGLAMVD